MSASPELRVVPDPPALFQAAAEQFVTLAGSVAAAQTMLFNGLLAGEAYLNIHTTQFPGGEISGFLAPIPEPHTWALLLAGLYAAGAFARRRQC